MLTKRGIEANLEKCQAIINMRSPRTVNEVQQLTGRITTLLRFLSRSTKTTVPIFKTPKKGDSFIWIVESEEAFLRLNALLATPPILTKLTFGIPLLIYISVAKEAVSAVVVQEKEGNQHLIYFVSKTLQEAKKISKDRKGGPRPGCGISEVTPLLLGMDLPIKQVLRKPDLASRMVAWSAQLSKFDISYENRGHIKA
ncbi:hypothetical protein CR513_15937, partial [Mucuna pruriens]